MLNSISTPIAVVIAATAGLVANSIGVAVWFGSDLFAYIFSPGRFAVAVIVAALLPVLFGALEFRNGSIVSLIALTFIPATLAKLAFGVGAPWMTVIILNFLYAAAAVGVYLVVSRALARTDAAVAVE